MHTQRSASPPGTLEELFLRFALLFGNQIDQDATYQYLSRLVSLTGIGSAATRERASGLSTARSRREAIEQLSWNPAFIRLPLQTWITGRIAEPHGILTLSERLFPRRESRGDGIAPHYAPGIGGVVNGQLGVFLSYVSDRGRATLDGRLIIPRAVAGQSVTEQRTQSKTELALSMLDEAHAELKTGLIVAGKAFGDDEMFREALRARGQDFLLEVSSTCPIFQPSSALLERATSSRRRGQLQPRDLQRAAISSAFSSNGRGLETPDQSAAIQESIGGVVGGPARAFEVPGVNGGEPRYFLTSAPGLTSSQGAMLVESVLESPSHELAKAAGESIYDRYDTVEAAGWHRHMLLAMLVEAWLHDREPAVTSSQLLSANGASERNPTSPVTLALPASALPARKVQTLTFDNSEPNRGWSTARKVATVVGLLLIAMVIGAVAIAREIPALGQRDLIRASLFYHPPEDGTSVGAVVSRIHHVIFTRGDERYLQQMRERGYTGPALQYLVANETSGPVTASSSNAPCGDYLQTGNDVTGIARDFCSALHSDERNFLHNSKGERLLESASYQDGNITRTRYYYLMNPGSPTWREYFAQRARENTTALPYTGIFLDNLDLTRRRATDDEPNSNGIVAEYANDRAYQDAVRGYLEVLRSQLGRTPIWANLTVGNNDPDEYSTYLPYIDGVMNEYFVAQERGRTVGPNGWAAQMAQADSVAAQGKAFLAVAHGAQSDVNRMRFALASYLMIAGPNAYFRYSDGERYGQVWYYDDYENRLGSPLGPRYQNGDQWQRDFTCGSVRVDVERRAGELSINSGNPKCLIERALIKLPFVSG